MQEEPTRPQPVPSARARRASTAWSRGWIIAFSALLPLALLLGHKYIPNRLGNLGSLVETFLPWAGLAVPVLLALTLLRRSWPAALATGLVAVLWLGMFGELVLPGKGVEQHNLRVLTHNVGAANLDPKGTAKALLEADADLVALEELSNSARPVYDQVMATRYPHHTTRGTVSLWSRYPLADASTVDIGIGWPRALRAEVDAPQGKVAVYVAHLASVRVDSNGFSSDQRNRTVADLAEHVKRESLAKVILLGDLNGTAYDRSLAPLTFSLQSAQAEAGDGFGFTWPAKVPLARIDHILVRGVTPARAWVLPRTGSDHRPIAADLRI